MLEGEICVYVCVCVCVLCGHQRKTLGFVPQEPPTLPFEAESLSLARGSPSNLDSQARDLKESTSPVLRLAVCTAISDLILCGFWGSVCFSCWQGKHLTHRAISPVLLRDFVSMVNLSLQLRAAESESEF